MKLPELEKIIKASSAGCNALEYAPALLEKINCLTRKSCCSPLLKQLCAAKEQGDFRGRVLEVNFAHCFESKSYSLQYGAKQANCSGDIDFLWELDDLKIYIELKHLGQDKNTRDSIQEQINQRNYSSTFIEGDEKDIYRLQSDFLEKASTKKFSTTLTDDTINLVAIDCTELQLGTCDQADCTLAAAGNTTVKEYFSESYTREEVVGFFEDADNVKLNEQQKEWQRKLQKKDKWNATSENICTWRIIPVQKFIFACCTIV